MAFFTKDFIIVTLRYSLDWILVIGFTAAAYFLGKIDGARRPFNPYDPAFSFPYNPDTVSVLNLGFVALLAPAVIILLSCLFAPLSALPALANYPHAPKSLIWKHRLVNWNRAWLGLGLTDALAFFISNTLKNVIGKPRPHMITVCQPDWAKVAEIVKSTRTGPNEILAWNPLVTAAEICTTTDNDRLSEAFRSFPSGHSTMAFSGLTYITIFLYSTLVLTLSKTSMSKHVSYRDLEASTKREDAPTRASKLHPPSLPLFTFVIVIFNFCLAMWIGCTRYLDFKHAGIDIFAGSSVGFLSAIVGSWWYAMPAAGGVAKGRVRAGYRPDDRNNTIPLQDFDEPRGPIAAGETIALHRDHDRFSVDAPGPQQPHYGSPDLSPPVSRKQEVTSVV